MIYLPSDLPENERTHIRRLDYVTRALAWLALVDFPPLGAATRQPGQPHGDIPAAPGSFSHNREAVLKVTTRPPQA